MDCEVSAAILREWHWSKEREARNYALFSLPRRRWYSPFRPKKLRKYHDSEETHRTSISGASMPRWSIDLNPKVKGNGSLTKIGFHAWLNTGSGFNGGKWHTQQKSLEEEINPPHYYHLRDHHNHLCLHTSHHAIHGTRVGKWVKWCATIAPLGRPIFEIGTCFKSFAEILRYWHVKRWGKGWVRRRSAEDLGAGCSSPTKFG